MTEAPHLRAILIAAALAFTALGLGWYTLNRQQPPPVPDTAVVAHHAVASPARAKAKTAAAKPTTAAKATAKPKAAAKPKATPVAAKPTGRAPVVQAAIAYGLPKPVAEQFASHAVVVVSVYAPDAKVDQLTEAEAQAGALLGGAGFTSIDTTKEGASGALTKLLGVVDVPATLVFQRPDEAAVLRFAAEKAAAGPAPKVATVVTPTVTPPEFKLFLTLSGFNDRETVAQAARNADPLPGLPVRQTAWAAQANALCTSASKQLASVGPLQTTAQLKSATPTYRKVGAAYLAGLRTLKAPAGSEDAVARFVALQAQDVSLTMQLAAATAKHDRVAAATLGVREDAVARQSSALALQLGATACGQGL
ncbi:MAG TPA: hypothetical protein VLN26_08575 [Gaiellaceae bacterium]|nr:hypothetical protein [Gaiellaceae bacterium]